MSERWQPWQRMLPVWVPAVLLCLACTVMYWWLSSDSLGRAAQLRERVAALEESIARLDRIDRQAARELESTSELTAALGRLYRDVFGSLDERLTRILRAVGSATREAGMLPGRFGYAAGEDDGLRAVRFGIQFTVTGQYAQVRQLLASLQASPEFLIVEGISFKGEEESPSRDVTIAVSLATYLAEAEREQLRQLIGDSASQGEDDGSE